MLLNLPSLRHVRETLLIFTFLSSLRCLSSQYGQAMIFFGQSLSRCFCKNLFWNFAPQSFMQRISAYSQFEFTWSCEHKQQYHFKTISISWCCREEGKMIVVWSQTFYINLYRRSQNKNSVGFNERTRGGELKGVREWVTPYSRARLVCMVPRLTYERNDSITVIKKAKSVQNKLDVRAAEGVKSVPDFHREPPMKRHLAWIYII